MKLEKQSKYLMDSKQMLSRYGKKLSLENIEKAILCFSPSVAEKLKRIYKPNRVHSLGACWDIYNKEKTLVLSQFGVGPSPTLLVWEYLKNFQIPKVFSVGAIASFDKKLKLGQQLLIQQAYEEYFPALDTKSSLKRKTAKKKKDVKKNKELLLIQTAYPLESKKLIKRFSLSSVTSVSCNQPYKLTKKHLRFYLSHFVSGLEMESAFLLSSSKTDQIPTFCLAVVSDFLDERAWDLGFSHKKFQNSFLDLLEKLLTHTDRKL